MKPKFIMKQYILIIIFSFPWLLFSQSCLPDGIIFSSQAQIDSFPNNYPGCTEIEGKVEVNGEDITNFSGLNAVTQIGGDLFIGTFFYGGNFALQNLSGLENLNYLGGSLRILSNPVLTSITGLQNLTSIGSNLEVSNNPINSFIGLDNVTSVGGRLIISSMNTITDLSGLESITSIGDRISITENDALTSLSGLDNLVSIGGGIEISVNKSLISLNGIDNIAAGTIDDLSIFSNNVLSNCHVQCISDYLAAPNGIVTIYNNATGCNKPSEIADSCGYTMPCLPFGDYYFHSQADIDSFQTDYPGCTTLKGHVQVIGGSDISNLYGFNSITSFEDKLWIILNPELTNLSGLDNLNSVGNFLFISQNYNLVSLTGLENLDSVGNDLHFSMNSSLTDITALSSLKSIGNSLSFVFNEELTDLAGLENIDPASIQELIIRNNNSLSNCAAQSICNYLSDPNGFVGVHDNAPGCNSPEEVIDDCTVDIHETAKTPQISIYPNPANECIIIDTEELKNNLNVDIYNLVGQIKLRMRLKSDKVDISALPNGVYILELKSDDFLSRHKFIKE